MKGKAGGKEGAGVRNGSVEVWAERGNVYDLLGYSYRAFLSRKDHGIYLLYMQKAQCVVSQISL